MKRLHLLCCIVLMLGAIISGTAQSLTQIEEIFPDLQQTADYSAYGYSVDIEGNFAVVGALKHNNDMGAAFVLEYDGTTWSKIATLTSSTPNKVDRFGSRVAITNELIIVTAPKDSTAGNDAGAVYFYEKPTSGWATMTESLKKNSPGHLNFGASIDIEGDIVVIGDKRNTYNGAVSIYEKSSISGWQLLNFKGTLTPSVGKVYGHFGQSVSISGNTILVGAYSPQNKGAAYIYEKPATGWATNTETAKLTASDEYNKDCFGFDVSLNGDIALVGAYDDDNTKGTDAGAVYAFNKPASGWQDATESTKILSSASSTGYNFGYSLSFDGTTLAVGMPSIGYKGIGKTIIYSYDGSTWTNEKTLSQKNAGYADYFGCCVAFSGNNYVSGAYADDTFAYQAGGAEFFLKDASTYSYTHINETFPDTYANSLHFRFGHCIDISGNTAVVGAFSEKPYGAAYILEYDGSKWEKVAKLSKTSPGTNDLLGVSVAIDNNTIVVAATGANGSRGAAYVYEKPAAGWTDMTETATLTTAGSFHFGVSAAIDGNTIIIGDDYYGSNYRGALFLFEKPASGWADATETAILTSSSTLANQYFGITTDIEGDVVVVGNPYVYSSRGRVQVFVKPEGGWVNTTETAMLSTASLTVDDKFGTSVSICGDLILTTSPYKTNTKTNAGIAYLFKKPQTGWATSTETLKFSDPYEKVNSNLGSNYVALTENNMYLGIGINDSLLTLSKQSSQTWTDVIGDSFNPERIGLSEGYNDYFAISGKYAIASNANNNKVSVNGGSVIILEQNQAPIISNQSFSIDENIANGTSIGTIAASDPENDYLTFSLTSGNDKNILNINSTNGNITVAYSDTLDFEKNQSFTFTITASDASSSSSAQMTLNINNLNDNSPNITDQTVSIDENTPQNTEIYDVVVDDIDNDPITLTITDGNTNSAFSVKPNTTTIVVAKQDLIDYELTTQYVLTVSASDGKNTTTGTVTINLNDLNDTPPTLTSNTYSVTENTYYNTVIDTVKAFDAEGDDITYKLLPGEILYSLKVDYTTGILRAGSTSIDYEKNKTLDYSLVLSDGTNTDTVEITLNVININDSRPAYNTDIKLSVVENSPKGTIIDTVPFSDADGDSLKFEISYGNDNEAYSIDSVSGALMVNKPELFDYENNKQHTLSLRASDGVYTSAVQVNIDILNANDYAPSLRDQILYVDENKLKGTLINTFKCYDADGDTLAYAIISGDTVSAFNLNATTGKLEVNKSSEFDYEKIQQYNLQVSVSDGLHADTASITVNINNLNDNAPVILTDTIYIDENLGLHSIVDTLKTFDADGSNLNYYFINESEYVSFLIDLQNGEILLHSDKLDYDTQSVYIIRAKVNDGEHETFKNITIILNEVKDIPLVFNDFSFVVNENEAKDHVIGTIIANDTTSSESIISYAIIDGNIDGAFQITPNNGSISIANHTVIDYETNPVFTLTVSATLDTIVLKANVTISLTNLNDNAPTAESLTTNINENPLNNTILATFTATDADGDKFEFSLTGDNNSNGLSIDQHSGSISVIDSSYIDYELNDTITLNIQLSDGLHTTPLTATIIINNLNDNAPVITDQEFTIIENAKNASIVGYVQASDADNDELTFAFSEASKNLIFNLDKLTGEISINDSSKIDYELVAVYMFNVVVSDELHTDTASIIINIEDINDSGIEINNQIFSIDENSASGTEVGSVAATHVNDSTLYYSIANDTLKAFTIDSINGIITIAKPDVLDYETQTACYLTIQASDGIGTGKASLTITINNINDNAPEVDEYEFHIDENSANGTIMGTIEATDLDNDNVTFSILSGNNAGTFSIDATSGELSITDNTELDYETNPEISLEIEVSDEVHVTKTLITIILNDVFESVTNIKTTNMNRISIYPNPSKDYVVIDTDNNETTPLNIFNSKGQLVLSKQMDSRIIDIQNLKSGLYLVHINNQVIKLIKD